MWSCSLLVVCVVETGSSKWQDKLSQIHAVQSTMNMPNIRSSGLLTKGACLAMLLLMVSVTLAPRRTAPRNSQTAAMITAWKMVMALAPTEVPKLCKVKTDLRLLQFAETPSA